MIIKASIYIKPGLPKPPKTSKLAPCRIPFAKNQEGSGCLGVPRLAFGGM